MTTAPDENAGTESISPAVEPIPPAAEPISPAAEPISTAANDDGLTPISTDYMYRSRDSDDAERR